jgi:hypothetical protein
MQSLIRIFWVLAALSGAAVLLYTLARFIAFEEPTTNAAPVRREMVPASTPSAVSGAAASEPESSGRPVIVQAPKEADARKRWNTALTSASTDRVAVLRHRAVISQSVEDVMAVRVALFSCTALMAPQQRQFEPNSAVSVRASDAEVRLRQRCSPEAFVPNSGWSKLVVRDGPWAPELTDKILAASTGALPDKDGQREVLAAVLATRSVLLLEAVSTNAVPGIVLEEIGVQADERIPPHLDRFMYVMAVRIAACRLRGDCEQMALVDRQCVSANRCVESLEDFPSRRMYGADADRALGFGLPTTLPTNVVRERYQLIAKHVDSLTKLP